MAVNRFGHLAMQIAIVIGVEDGLRAVRSRDGRQSLTYLADAAAKKYIGQLGGTFSVADRREVANRMADSFRDEAGLGNYDNLL